jgi:hypothetical protein
MWGIWLRKESLYVDIGKKLSKMFNGKPKKNERQARAIVRAMARD